MRRSPGHRPSGFTLLELLVVSMLMIVVAMVTAQLWRHFSAQNANLTQRAEAARELKIAIENIRQDMGAVLWATPSGSDTLLICVPAKNERGQAVIQYSMHDGLLMRYDQSIGVSVPVAAGLRGFVAEDVTPSVLRLVVTTACGRDDRQATLIWSRS